MGHLTNSWRGAVELGVAIGIAYFLAARLGLALRAQVGVAVFWPAAGIATGALIALGPAARLPVTVAVAVASMTSSLVIGRNPWLVIIFVFLNAGEVLVTAWLVRRWFAGVFRLEDVPHVLGFLVASAIAAGVGAAGAAIAVTLVEPRPFSPEVLRIWFVAGLLGTVTVAPLLIGLCESVREPPPRRELLEGTIALVTLGVTGAFVISLPPGAWATAVPVIVVLPIVFWIAVRCRPVFAAAAAFIVALTVATSMALGLGDFGDASVALPDRTLAVQTIVLAGALCLLLLSALFAERREYETILEDNNRRLQLVLAQREKAERTLSDRNRQLDLAGKAALVGRFAIEIDVARGDFSSQRVQVSPGFAAIYGLSEETVEISVGDRCSLVHPDDLPQFLERRQQLFAERRGEHHAEYRIVRPCGTTRWIEARSFIEYDQAGHAKRMIGVNIDITERKRAEEARKILNAELDHRVKNALATVIAVISQTRQGSRSVADFATALERRIRSMASTHELLSSRHWQELSLIDLIRCELAPYTARKNTEINGPTVLLKPEAGRALAMVLHELATNAAKYGALSSNKGRVLVRWDRQLNGRPISNLVLEWWEVGGPRVDAPGKSSYGTSTIQDLIPYEFGGTVDLVFAPEGVRCRLELPPDWLTNASEPTEVVADTAR